MPRPERMEIKLSVSEKADLEAQAKAEGKAVAVVVRERLFGEDAFDAQSAVQALDQRVSRLEQMAGLE